MQWKTSAERTICTPPKKTNFPGGGPRSPPPREGEPPPSLFPHSWPLATTASSYISRFRQSREWDSHYPSSMHSTSVSYQKTIEENGIQYFKRYCTIERYTRPVKCKIFLKGLQYRMTGSKIWVEAKPVTLSSLPGTYFSFLFGGGGGRGVRGVDECGICSSHWIRYKK